jgi:uncharacterized repeat protein (TIGR03847 family)
MTFFFEFENPESFATGAIGRPGERTFYLQVTAEGRTISVKCEKQQVLAIATYLREMLADMPLPTNTPSESVAEIRSPVEEDFVLGSVGLGIDRASSRMLVQLEEMQFVEDDDDDIFDLLDDDDDDESSSSLVRALITPEQALAFCNHAESIVSAGRETCRWCGFPMDAGKHICPRMN